jgi:hypothetical protein
MTNTGYKISSGKDLVTLFKPYTSGATKAAATGYTISGGADLSDLFEIFSTNQAAATGYTISGGADLNTIFERIPQPYYYSNNWASQSINALTLANTGTTTTVTINPQAAIDVKVLSPRYICVDTAFNIYMSSETGFQINKINGSTGNITRYAGTGTTGNEVGTAATSCKIGNTCGLTIDSNFNLYFCDTTNKNVKKVTAAGVLSIFIAASSMPNTENYARSITCDNTHLYVGEFAEYVVNIKHVYQYKLDGTGSLTSVIATAIKELGFIGLGYNNNTIYASLNNSSTLYSTTSPYTSQTTKPNGNQYLLWSIDFSGNSIISCDPRGPKTVVTSPSPYTTWSTLTPVSGSLPYFTSGCCVDSLGNAYFSAGRRTVEQINQILVLKV